MIFGEQGKWFPKLDKICIPRNEGGLLIDNGRVSIPFWFIEHLRHFSVVGCTTWLVLTWSAVVFRVHLLSPIPSLGGRRSSFLASVRPRFLCVVGGHPFSCPPLHSLIYCGSHSDSSACPRLPISLPWYVVLSPPSTSGSLLLSIARGILPLSLPLEPDVDTPD